MRIITKLALKRINKKLNQQGMEYADRFLEKCNKRRRHVRTATQEEVGMMKALAWKINDVAATLKLTSPCICRSLWCYKQLAGKYGVEMIIGVKGYPFEAHAWIEYNKEVINDTEEPARGYIVFEGVSAKDLITAQA